MKTPTVRGLSRRTLLGAAASTASLAVASPFVARRARAQSGQVNIFAWAGYISDEMLAAFQSATGITPNFTPYGTNDEALNQLRANNGSGFDIVWPTVDRVPNYVEFGLVQPLDESKVEWDRVIASAVSGSAEMGAVVDGTRYQVPMDWGTEALSFDREQAPLTYGEASYGDMLNPEFEGMVTARGHSLLASIGIWLESQGRLPHPMRESFTDEAKMVANYDVILAEAVKAKANFAQFWSNENEAQGAFRVNGCVIGQTWDSTAAGLAREGLPIGYIAPKEGALAWMEGVCIPSGAANIDEAYAFINWMLTPEAGAMYANLTSINSTAVGADALLSDEAKQFFADAYPGDALDKLWWWPIQPAWFVAKRTEYADRFMAA
ncbi:MAG: extracellular solute-binding protein [Rubrimonas sp.]